MGRNRDAAHVAGYKAVFMLFVVLPQETSSAFVRAMAALKSRHVLWIISLSILNGHFPGEPGLASVY